MLVSKTQPKADASIEWTVRTQDRILSGESVLNNLSDSFKLIGREMASQFNLTKDKTGHVALCD